MAPKPPAYTQTPNELFDKWVPVLREAELKVYLIIVRKTFGWHKNKDRISLSQLETLTGLHRSNITKAIKSLLERGIITKETIGEVGRQKTTYQLVMDEEVTNEQEDVFKEISNGSCKKTGGGLEKRPTKETIQNKDRSNDLTPTFSPQTKQVSPEEEEKLKIVNDLKLDKRATKKILSLTLQEVRQLHTNILHTTTTISNMNSYVMKCVDAIIEERSTVEETSTEKPQKKDFEADLALRLKAIGAEKNSCAAGADKIISLYTPFQIDRVLTYIEGEIAKGSRLNVPVIEYILDTLKRIAENSKK